LASISEAGAADPLLLFDENLRTEIDCVEINPNGRHFNAKVEFLEMILEISLRENIFAVQLNYNQSLL
jgi:hypothetical protein